MVSQVERRLAMLVDPEEASRELYMHWLSANRFGVLSTLRGSDALWLLRRHTPEFIVAQERLRDMSAIDFLGQLRSQYSTTNFPVVVLCKSAAVQPDLRMAGASAVLPSLGALDALSAVIRTLIAGSRRYVN